MRVHGAQPMMQAPAFQTRLKGLVDALSGLGSTPVLLCNLLPVRGAHFPGTSREFVRYNEAIAHVARSTGATLVNWDTSFLPDESIEELYFADGLHLNTEGSARLARHLLQALARPLDLPTTAPPPPERD
jgi:lysophospholipase L1-like esterase